MTTAPIRRLLTGLDTVQVAYYLAPSYGGAFSFSELLIEKERLRTARSREGKAVQIGERSFLVRAYGSGSGYPLVLENAQVTVECGEFNTPGFFVTFRSQALGRTDPVTRQTAIDPLLPAMLAGLIGKRSVCSHSL